jgi:hypothetical protein
LTVRSLMPSRRAIWLFRDRADEQEHVALALGEVVGLREVGAICRLSATRAALQRRLALGRCADRAHDLVGLGVLSM